MSGPQPRRHHYLPQMYQRAFADEKGQVRVLHVDGSWNYVTGTKNAFVERDYYTGESVDSAVDHELVESRIYAETEGIADPILRDLVDRRLPMTLQPRAEFGTFMALLVTRGLTTVRSRITSPRRWGGVSQLAAAMTPPEHWERERREWEEGGRVGPEPPGPFTEEQKRQLAHGELFRATATKQYAIEMSFSAVEELGRIFFMMDWSLVSFDAPCLFSGPLPVTYWRRPTDSYWDDMGIGPVTADEVLMPLSPSRALVLTHPPRDQLDPSTVGSRDRTLVGSSATAAHVNQHHADVE